jgi:hypothetical protein
MKKLTALALSIILTSALASCSSATDDDADSNGGGTVTIPTLSSLVGTWKNSSTSDITDNSGSVTSTETSANEMSVFADGSYLTKSTSIIKDTSGTTTSSLYTDKKGKISLSGDQLTTEQAQTRGSNSPFADDTSGWADNKASNSSECILVGDRLFPQVLAAEGSVSGLVGTWATNHYHSTSSKPYGKASYAFTSEGKVTISYYQSASAAFSDTPDQSNTYNYAINDNGSLTITADGSTKSNTMFYSIKGSYMVIGNDKSIDAFAYIKQ